MYKVFLLVIICFYFAKFILNKFKKKDELENFVNQRKKDNICSRPFIVKGKASNYSKLLALDKKIDEMELVIMKKRRENTEGRLNKMDKKYKWMLNYYQSTTDPNSLARKNRQNKAKSQIRKSFKNRQNKAMKQFKNKYGNAFFSALRNGTSLPRIFADTGSKFRKTMSKYSDPRKGNIAKRRAKNKARNKIREGEDDLWEPIKSIVKGINDLKENRMKADFRKNDNAPGFKGVSFGPPREGREISNKKFSGAYA